MAEVIPAILEKDFKVIEEKIRLVEGLVKWVQIDVADGLLVPNTTPLDPTPFSSLKTNLNLELHMMVKDPISYVEGYVQAGFKRLFAHVEADHVEDFVDCCYKYNVEVGVAIDGPTSFEKIKPYIDNVDAVLVMAIEAGFSGRPFRQDTIEKIQKIRATDFEIPIAVDGAMNEGNARKVVEAGATRINSNSYIFGAQDVREPIEKLEYLSFRSRAKSRERNLATCLRV